MASFDTLRNTFLGHLEQERQLSKYTVRNYAHAIERLLQWWLGQKWPQDRLIAITPQQARAFVIEQQHTLSRKTLHMHVSGLRTFFHYLLKHKKITVNPWAALVLPKTEKSLPKFLTEKQIVNLLAGPMRLLEQETLKPFEAWRDRLVLELLYGGGLRVSELVALNYGSIDKRNGVARILGKGSKERLCPLGKVALACLEKFETEFASSTDTQSPVLVTKAGKRLNVRTVQRLVKKYLGLADLPMDITPHKIRHTYATHLLNNGADLRLLQDLLGHASLSSTQVYTHVDMARLKEAHKQAHPRP
tara:strand:- start:21341 stop:22252 length:912 start_codon:yes stop_codon:yes gene_type:complete